MRILRKSGKMASHNELGKEGENAAVKYLLEKDMKSGTETGTPDTATWTSWHRKTVSWSLWR